MHSHLFTDISLIIAIAAVIALIMRALRQPLIIGHILTGIIAGPAVLGILNSDNEAFGALSSIGISLLLFIIGLDLSVKVFSRLGKTIAWTAFVQVTVIGLIGAGASRYVFDFGRMESLVIGLALALSSTIIIVKLLNDKREMTRLYAQITIGILIIQDVIATAGKIGMATRAQSDGSALEVAILLGRGIGLTVALFLISKYVIPRLTKTLESNKELLLVFALGWGIGFAALFERVGFSIEIGALFAGISLASLPYSSQMASRLKPLRDFFLIIFLITLGQTLTPRALMEVLGVTVALSAIVIFIKPLVVMSVLGAQGYTKRASFKSAVSLGQVSEFSLVLLASAYASGLASERAVTTVTMIALLTFITSTYVIKYDDLLFKLFEKHLRFFERKVTRYGQRGEDSNHPIILFGYQKGGPEFVKTFKRMKQRFVVIDYDPEVIETLERQDIPYLYGDATDSELLEEMRLDKARLVVSIMSNFDTNMFLARWLDSHNSNAVVVCSADSAAEASDLYNAGASYVMMPHYIGSEKISSFIKRNGFSKSEFKAFREKHLSYLQTNYTNPENTES